MAQTTTKTQQRTSVVETPPAPVDNLPAPRPRAAVQPIVPANWQEITAIASAICRANMAPKSYCKTDAYGKLIYVDGKPVPEPEKVAIAIMHGMEVGMTPMTSLQSLAVINGMPSVYGDGLVGLVRASGWLEDLREGLQTDEQGKPMIAWCKVKRRGEASWKERELTYVECVRAGWTKKEGPWTLTPGRMMTVRVRGWLLRDMFADVLRGLHSAEEIEDMVDVTPQGSATAAEPKRADYAAQAGPQQDTGRAGMATNETTPQTPPRDQGDVDGQAGGDQAPADGEKAKGTPDQPAITDAVDLNDAPQDGIEHDPKRPLPGEKLEFARFAKVAEFADFADTFLPETNAEGARQFGEFYEGTLVAMERGKPGSVAAATEIRATLAKMTGAREPGQEG